MAIAERVGALRRLIPGRREHTIVPGVTADEVRERRLTEEANFKEKTGKDLHYVVGEEFVGVGAVTVYISRSPEGEFYAQAVDKNRSSEGSKVMLGNARFPDAKTMTEAITARDLWITNSATVIDRGNNDKISADIKDKYSETDFVISS